MIELNYAVKLITVCGRRARNPDVLITQQGFSTILLWCSNTTSKLNAMGWLDIQI